MRHLLLVAGLLLGLGSDAAAQSRAFKKLSVRGTTCPRADSIAGPLGGKTRKVPALRPEGSDTLLLMVASEQVNQGLSSPFLQVTLRAGREASTGYPDATLSFLITGDAGRRLLATKQAPSLTIELADSIVLAPSPVSLGTYDGPPSFATAPLSAAIGSNSLIAIVRSDSLLARAGLTYLRPTSSFREKLRDAFRVATCGYSRIS